MLYDFMVMLWRLINRIIITQYVVQQAYPNRRKVRSAVTATAVLLVGYWISIVPISYGHSTADYNFVSRQFFQESRLHNTRLRENV